MENRKSTILLTVIAVATLLVAVVGATFAYFTAQGGAAANTPVTVQTYKTSTGSFNLEGAELSISASQQNFVENGNSLQDTGTATATFTGATGTGESGANVEQDFCYTVSLEVAAGANGFIAENVPVSEGSGTVAANNPDVLLFNASINNGTDNALDDNGSLGAATWVASSTGYQLSTGTAGQTTTFSGFDIIALDEGKYPVVINGATTTAGSVNVYKLTSNGTAADTDTWTFSLTLVNTTEDQNTLTGTSGISYASKIVFDQVSCTDGSVVEP